MTARTRLVGLALAVGLSLVGSSCFAQSAVSVQLRWLHQFQFAGYYAALNKGFYKDVGLDVTLVEGGPNVSAIDQVLQGRAQFGVSTSGLINAYQNGKPVLILAPIIQHSPLVLLSLGKDKTNPVEIAKAGTISLQPGDESLELKAMFINEGIPLSKVNITTDSQGLPDLLSGKIVAMNAYLSNEPFWLEQHHIPYSVLKPGVYGMDFYSDVLFTSRDFNNAQPKAVGDFRAATIKGWEYALDHQDEIIGLILAHYNTQGKTREQLLYEAKVLRQFITPDLIQIGHSNPSRWLHIAEAYSDQGMLPEVSPLIDTSLKGFLYDPNPKSFDLSKLYMVLAGVLCVTAAITGVAVYIHRLNVKLQANEKRLQLAASVFVHASEGILIAEPDGKIVDVNEAFVRITGYDRDDVLGHTPRLLKSGRHDAEFYVQLWGALIQAGYWAGEVWNRRKSGEIFPAMQYISAVRDDHGELRNYVSLFSDITERKEMEGHIRYLAFYDALTLLPNRRLLDDRLAQAVAASKRSDCLCALMFLDLDNFKPLNDTYGHVAGDLLLVQVAERLKNCVREIDTVARFGGDEFVVLLNDLSANQHEARSMTEMIAAKILTALSEPYSLSVRSDLHVEHQCTASIGVTLFNGRDAEFDELLKQADAAMYRVKDAGRNAIRFHDEQQKVLVEPRG